MEAELAAFSAYLQNVRGRSSATAAAYLRDVSAFGSFCQRQGLEPARGLTRSRVGQYLMERLGTGARAGQGKSSPIGTRSAARAVSALKAYGDFLAFEGKFSRADLEPLKPPKYSRKLPPYLNVEEVLAVVRAFDSDPTPAGLRNAALLHLLYGAGLRLAECHGLTLRDVRLEARIVGVLGKGSRRREAPFGSAAARAIQAYLRDGRPALSSEHSAEWLWLGRSGRQLSRRSYANILDTAALLVGCLKPISPHKLRHACATHMLEGGADVRLLQELLGHQSLDTTQQYTQITRTKLLEAYDLTHPRARKG